MKDLEKSSVNSVFGFGQDRRMKMVHFHLRSDDGVTILREALLYVP